jgi:hypothetical protein
VTETIEGRLKAALQQLTMHVSLMEAMARWKQDLEGRLWRASMVHRALGQSLYDLEALEDEVRLYSEIVRKLEEKRSEHGDQRTGQPLAHKRPGSD